MEKQVFTVSGLNNRIKGLFELDPVLFDVCVKGELSNYKTYPSGHHYFTLKDSESALSCVMFRSNASRLRFKPENGMSVIAFGRVDAYTRDGTYKLITTGIMPQGTGDLQIAFEQLKSKLEAEGLFDREHKKALPEYPETIALITSSAGAAVHDMIRILGSRWPLSKVVLLPVRVQGAEAPAEIAGAIRYANEFKVADVIITGRGGGSMEDLWAFNDERVARAIYASELPVISAVGHEPDVTISDYVADRRASTPSNAAEIAVLDKNEVSEELDAYSARLNQSIDKKIRILSDRLDALKAKKELTNPAEHIENRRMELDRLYDRLISAQERLIHIKSEQYISLAAALDALSPLKVLSRGYTIPMSDDGEIVKSVASLNEGDKLNLFFADGKADCTVNTVLSD